MGFTAQEATNRSGAAKTGNFSVNAASFRWYREMCGLLQYIYNESS